ncbi:MAG TPA: type II toxin-antitoxin system RelE/ParE family toxin [Gemmata sp.]|jgi:plasmid stabilization system protein ParE|nr:type II toxin-antitoxin system RelE/ParE family toxin [Gemmata sp.]
MANVAFHPAAQREYQAAVGWYQQRNPAAARRFVAEVDRVMAQISIQPDRFGWYDDEFRETVLRRYPYSMVYRIESSGDERSPTQVESQGIGKTEPDPDKFLLLERST